MQEVNWKDPKILIGIFAGVAAVGMTLYNCRGSGPGVPLNQAEVTDEILREVAARTFLAIQGGQSPKAVAELPPLDTVQPPRNLDAWGSEFTFQLEGAEKKTKTATIVSPGPDKQAGTADDLRCTAVFKFQTGPGYDVYHQSSVEVTTGAN